MKLQCWFYDAKGCSLASPVTVENADERLAYETACGFRNAVEAQRGVKVYLHTTEGPENKFVSREIEDDSA